MLRLNTFLFLSKSYGYSNSPKLNDKLRKNPASAGFYESSNELGEISPPERRRVESHPYPEPVWLHLPLLR